MGRFAFHRPASSKSCLLKKNGNVSRNYLLGKKGGVERIYPTTMPLYSMLLPQPVKLLFLSNRNARSLEIISIMFGSNIQVQMGAGKNSVLRCWKWQILVYADRETILTRLGE